MIESLSKVLPQLAIIAGVCAMLGWTLRGLKQQPATAAKPASTPDKQDRAKNLEAALEKSKAAHKSLKSELENLQSASVLKATYDLATASLETTRQALDTETKRIATLEADLRKSQETLKHLNARVNEADKAQKDRSFALENELSKAREQLAILQNRPDDSANLLVEIERLRESVAVSSRYAGEMRKREAAAIEALEKFQASIPNPSDSSHPAAAAKKIGPVGDSNRIAAAKAEVLRLVEMNRQKAETAEAETAEAKISTTDEPTPPPTVQPVAGELFALD